jgi:hypothetical protein
MRTWWESWVLICLCGGKGEKNNAPYVAPFSINSWLHKWKGGGGSWYVRTSCRDVVNPLLIGRVSFLFRSHLYEQNHHHHHQKLVILIMSKGSKKKGGRRRFLNDATLLYYTVLPYWMCSELMILWRSSSIPSSLHHHYSTDCGRTCYSFVFVLPLSINDATSLQESEERDCNNWQY